VAHYTHGSDIPVFHCVPRLRPSRVSRAPRGAAPVWLVRASLALVLATIGGVSPAAADETALFRVFLRDGTSLVSYGEFARVGDRVVFTLPLGEADGSPQLQVVTVPADRVDWTRSEQYRHAVRASRYAEQRGEHDFALMTGEVARVLNDIALTPDADERLRIAEEARKRLADWPGQHYGYRAREVREIAALLDEAISELRAAVGGERFDLSLVAALEPPETALLLAPPTPAELIAQALSLADASDTPAERIDVLRATIAFIDATPGASSPAALRHAREFASARLQKEQAADRAYAAFTTEAAGLARAAARRADVRAVERLLGSLDARDERLGRQRPEQFRAIRAFVGEQLEAAQRLRLARDQWEHRVSAYRSYARLVRAPLVQLDVMQKGLDEIKRLAGPDGEALLRLRDAAARAARDLTAVVPPSELGAVHSLLQSACQMAGTAATVRLHAVATGDMNTAWSASAAAAGAQALLGQARDELGRYLAPPGPR
jgi:hypothetical protein